MRTLEYALTLAMVLCLAFLIAYPIAERTAQAMDDSANRIAAAHAGAN